MEIRRENYGTITKKLEQAFFKMLMVLQRTVLDKHFLNNYRFKAYLFIVSKSKKVSPTVKSAVKQRAINKRLGGPIYNAQIM